MASWVIGRPGAGKGSLSELGARLLPCHHGGPSHPCTTSYARFVTPSSLKWLSLLCFATHTGLGCCRLGIWAGPPCCTCCAASLNAARCTRATQGVPEAGLAPAPTRLQGHPEQQGRAGRSVNGDQAAGLAAAAVSDRRMCSSRWDGGGGWGLKICKCPLLFSRRAPSCNCMRLDACGGCPSAEDTSACLAPVFFGMRTCVIVHLASLHHSFASKARAWTATACYSSMLQEIRQSPHSAQW